MRLGTKKNPLGESKVYYYNPDNPEKKWKVHGLVCRIKREDKNMKKNHSRKVVRFLTAVTRPILERP